MRKILMMVTSLFSFPHFDSKRFLFQISQKLALYGDRVNSLPNDKILDRSKLKQFADDKINVTKIEICFEKCRKCGKRRKCWLPAFSPFPTMFSKGFNLGH